MATQARIVDLGEWAEADFSSRCARAGVTRNRSHQDRTGWDYLVEFRGRTLPDLPADLQPADVSVRVQVKSKEKGRAFVDLKLSNALRFAKDPSPCFLILYLATGGGEPVRIYARHFWTAEVELALRRARQADAEGRADLNRLRVRYAFDAEDDRTEDVVSWMRSVVSGRRSYAEEKQSLVRTLGFEEGSVHGSVIFAYDDLERLIDHQIGLQAEAPRLTMTVSQRRFGIDASRPLFSGSPDLAHLRSLPEPARVRIRPAEGPDLWLAGELFRSAIPAPPEIRKLRVVADFLEFIVFGAGRGTVSLHVDAYRRRSLASHRALIKVTQLAAAGPLNMLITADNLPNLPIQAELPGLEPCEALEQLSRVVSCLEKATAGVLPDDLSISRSEIDDAWDEIVEFNGLVAGTDFRGAFELEAAPGAVIEPAATFFFGHVKIGEWVFGAVVRRTVEDFVLVQTSGRMALGPARVVEAVVRRGDVHAAAAELRALYRQAIRPEQTRALELFGGDYGRLVLFGRSSSGATPPATRDGDLWHDAG